MTSSYGSLNEIETPVPAAARLKRSNYLTSLLKHSQLSIHLHLPLTSFMSIRHSPMQMKVRRTSKVVILDIATHQ